MSDIDEEINLDSDLDVKCEDVEMQMHPADLIAQQTQARFMSCPVQMLPDPLAGSEGQQPIALIYMLQEVVNGFRSAGRVTDAEILVALDYLTAIEKIEK